MRKIFQTSTPPVKRFFQSKLSLPILGLIFLFSLSVSFFYAIVSFLILWITAMVHVDKRIKRSKPNLKDTSFMIIFFLFTYLMIGACPPLAYSQQAPTQQYSQVSLDWNEFKKTIGMDKDEIQLTWDEFQKIVNQTPKKINPVYSLRKGKG